MKKPLDNKATKKIMVELRKDLLDLLPEEIEERDVYINRAVDHELKLKERLSLAGSTKSEAKSAAARENGRKSAGRPRQQKKAGSKENKNAGN